MKLSSIEAAQNGQLGKPVISVAADTALGQALSLLKEHEIHHLVVTENEQLAGLLSPKAIMQYLQNNSELDWETPVAQVMLPNPPTLTEDQDVSETLETMRQVGATALPVVIGGKILGLITETDLLMVFEQVIEESEDDFHLKASFKTVMANPVIQNMMKIIGDAGI